MKSHRSTIARASEERAYPKLKSIDGSHSLKTAAPGAYFEYRARQRHGGKVFFFNYELAKEMGLIPANHPHTMNEKLEAALLDTFSLVIINEYDQIHKVPIPARDIKAGTYMATRYLQLQHPSRKGVTSGDGRGIWNGEVKHRGVTWDIASSGTGATCLSPATAIEKTFFKTGDKEVCYGNGYNWLDDALNTALMSEVFAKNNIATERALLIIEYRDGSSIYVRAGKNLLRPSHFFSPLKQNNLPRLTQLVEHFIERQISNGDWPTIRDSTKRLDYLIERVALDFAQAAARFESDYIFCWMDWDGDNILTNGGIIDYGSVRQFGLYHHEYRYDDDARYSTNLVEQRQKARYIVQTFAQIRDYLQRGKKRNIVRFRQSPALKLFDQSFVRHLNENLLHKIGFNTEHIRFLTEKHSNRVHAFKHHYSSLERTQCSRGLYSTEDGITSDGLFRMRDVLRELPRLLQQKDGDSIEAAAFIELSRASYAKKKDLALKPGRVKQIQLFQDTYRELIRLVADHFHDQRIRRTLLELGMRASIRNPYNRITGDGAVWVCDQILKNRKRLRSDEIHDIITGIAKTLSAANPIPLKPRTLRIKETVEQGLEIIATYRETI